MPLRAGVIGIGYLGRHHARIYSELDGVHLTAVCDRHIEKAEEAGRALNAKAFSDYREMFDSVDVLSIVTETSTHYEIALECLDAGKDILIEKPITSTVNQADAVIEAANRLGRTVQVGHIERYNPAVSAARRAVTDPVYFEASRMSPYLGRGIDVDITLDLMIHDIDIVLGFLQNRNVREIKAVGITGVSGRIDYAKAWLEFGGGEVAVLTSSRLEADKDRRLRIHMKDSMLHVDYQAKKVVKSVLTAEGTTSEDVKVDEVEPLKAELRDFADCIKGRRCPMVSAIEGRDALALAVRITEIINGRI